MSEWQSLQSDGHEGKTKRTVDSGQAWTRLKANCVVDKIQVGLSSVSTFLSV